MVFPPAFLVHQSANVTWLHLNYTPAGYDSVNIDKAWLILWFLIKNSHGYKYSQRRVSICRGAGGHIFRA